MEKTGEDRLIFLDVVVVYFCYVFGEGIDGVRLLTTLMDRG